MTASLASIQLDFGAYPDGQLEVRWVVVQDRVAVVEFQFDGSNTQPLTLFNGQELPSLVGRFASAAPSSLRSTSRA